MLHDAHRAAAGAPLMRPLGYDLLYRWGAPWEIGPRSELVELVESGRLTPERLAPGRAIDLGCGTGVDFSTVALRKAERKARAAGLSERVRFVRGDLTAESMPGASGPFDLLVDYGTLDDLAAGGRRRMADTVIRLARPGALFLLWAFHAARAELPWISFDGPSKLAPGLEPGEERELFGSAFEIERLPTPETGSRFACFLMRRRP